MKTCRQTKSNEIKKKKDEKEMRMERQMDETFALI